MATPKITAPDPSIFAIAPTERTFAEGVLNRDMSGLSYMLMNAAQDRARADQGAYMQGLQQTNALGAVLAKQEQEQEMQKELLKGFVTLAQHGYMPKDIPIAAMLFSDPSSASANEPSTLEQGLTRAKIAELGAKAAAAGQAGADTHTTEYIMDPNGVPQIKYTTKSKAAPTAGPDPRMIELLRQRGIKYDPNKPYAYMSRTEAEAAAKAVADGKFRNIRD